MLLCVPRGCVSKESGSSSELQSFELSVSFLRSSWGFEKPKFDGFCYSNYSEDPIVDRLRTQLGAIHPLPSPTINRSVIGLFVFFFFVGVAFDKLWTWRQTGGDGGQRGLGPWPQVPTSFSLFLEKDLQRKESVEWVNMVLGKLWKVYRAGIENWLVGLLQPVIDDLKKPDYVQRVEIKQFSLGDEPLSVRNVERRTSRRANDLQYVYTCSRLSSRFLIMLLFPVIGGKSAILTALCVAFRCRARGTQRAATLKDFIKTGCSYALVHVELKNQGEDAFKPEIYGDTLIIERRISDSTSLTVLKDHQEELRQLVEHYNIDVENPCVIMSQDKSREFLHSGNDKDKFKFFYKATLLQQVDDLLQSIGIKLKSANALMDEMEKTIKPIEKEISELLEKIKNMEHVEEITQQLKEQNEKIVKHSENECLLVKIKLIGNCCIK
ncbi:unnamed protein product [Arabidopsis lyrata]|nr:unnamed protein product [Arabidopsis lyrata]